MFHYFIFCLLYIQCKIIANACHAPYLTSSLFINETVPILRSDKGCKEPFDAFDFNAIKKLSNQNNCPTMAAQWTFCRWRCDVECKMDRDNIKSIAFGKFELLDGKGMAPEQLSFNCTCIEKDFSNDELKPCTTAYHTWNEIEEAHGTYCSSNLKAWKVILEPEPPAEAIPSPGQDPDSRAPAIKCAAKLSNETNAENKKQTSDAKSSITTTVVTNGLPISNPNASVAIIYNVYYVFYAMNESGIRPDFPDVIRLNGTGDSNSMSFFNF